MQSIPYIGEACALISAVLWGLSIVLFKQSGNKLSPLALNFFKNCIGFVFLLGTILWMGDTTFSQASRSDYLWVLASGAVGIGLSDTLFFISLNRLGAGNIAIVESFYSPLVILFSFFLLGERLSFLDGLGASLILMATLLPSVWGTDKHLSKKKWIRGLLYGFGAMATVAIAIVVIKPIIERESLLWVTTVRMGGGILGLLVYALVGSKTKNLFSGFRPQKAWEVAIPGGVLGAYLTLLIFMAGLKYTTASVAALLNQTSTAFIVLFAVVLLKEKLGWEKSVSIVLALTGSLLVIV